MKLPKLILSGRSDPEGRVLTELVDGAGNRLVREVRRHTTIRDQDIGVFRHWYQYLLAECDE